MQAALRLTIALIACVIFAMAPGSADAQVLKQIELSEKKVLAFVAAQKDMARITEKMQNNTSNKPDPKIQAELEATAKKHGFASFNEYDDVAANIAMIMAGIDPQTKKFTEPGVAIKREIAEVEADKSIPAKDKKQMLDELNAALKTAAPVRYPGNIDLVQRHFDRIEAALQ